MTFMLGDHFGVYQAPRDEAVEAVAKAAGHGEGTRGGKVIGHTKSGKPIYAASHEHYHDMHHISGNQWEADWHKDAIKESGQKLRSRMPDFNASDHHDASIAHAQAGSDLMATYTRGKKSRTAAGRHAVGGLEYDAWKHEDAAQAHQSAAQHHGDPSHGDTPSPLSGLSRKEHLAARDAHLAEAQKHSKMLSRLKRHGADEYDKDFQHVDNALIHHVQMAHHHLSEAGGLPVKKSRPSCL